MKLIAWVAGVATLVASGAYVIVSLARWEWNRALFFLMVLLVAEAGLGFALTLSRMARLERRVGSLDAEGSVALDALRRTRGDYERFPWLKVDPAEVVTRSNVFITMIVGGGVVLSGGAWLIDKLATRTVDPRREAALGHLLESIAYRPGLVVDDVTALARSLPYRDEPRLGAFLRRRP